MEQSSITPPPIGGETPKKKKGGCLKIGLIVMGVFFLMGIISAIFGDDKTETESAKADVESVEEEQSEESMPTIDSVMIAKLKHNFNEESDEFKGVTWIKPKSAPKYIDQNGIYTYFSVKDGVPENFRFVIQYAADEWLFIRNYTFLIDGKVYKFSSPEMKTDNNSRIWEWSDTKVENDPELLIILGAMLNASEVKIRFNGRHYHKDKTLSQKDIKSVVEPFEYYKALGGK